MKKTFSDLNKSIRKGETRDVEIKHITKERLPFEGYDERYKIDMKYIANIEKQLKNSRAAILNKLSIISSKFSFEFSESFTIVFIKNNGKKTAMIFSENQSSNDLKKSIKTPKKN